MIPISESQSSMNTRQNSVSLVHCHSAMPAATTLPSRQGPAVSSTGSPAKLAGLVVNEF